MCYVIFHRDFPSPDAWGACGLTTWTQHAFDRKEDAAVWSVEAHDYWPERKNKINLLELKKTAELPENVCGISREEFMERYFTETKKAVDVNAKKDQKGSV